MRLHGRRDANHLRIVRELRQAGFSVLDLGAVGDGCPDILVGKGGRNYAFEIKNLMAPPSARKLTAAEKLFHESWQGQVAVIHSFEEAILEFKR